MGRPILTPGYYRSYTQEHNKFPPSHYRVSAPSTTCTDPAHHEVEYEEPLCEDFHRFLDNSLSTRSIFSRPCPNAPLLAASSLPVLAPTPAAISGHLKEDDDEVEARDEDSSDEETTGPVVFEAFLPLREYGRHPAMDRVRAPAEGRRNTDGGANPLRPHPHHYQSASAASGEDNAVDWVRQRNFRLRRRLPELLRAPRSSPTPLPLPPPRPVEDLQLDDDDDDNDSILSFETVSTPIRATSPRTDATSEEEEEEEKEEPTPIPPPTRPLRRETMRTVEHGRILRSSSGPFHPVILPLRRRTESEVREVQSGLGLQRMRI